MTITPTPASQRFAPACANWVDRHDPDEWCQSESVFTGCIIVESNQFTSSVFDANDEVLEGYHVEGVSPSFTYSANGNGTLGTCQTDCLAAAWCNVWELDSDGVCRHYSDADTWSRYLYPDTEATGITTVGTFGGGSGGYLVPNQHAGPTVDMHPATTGRAYAIEEVFFFVNSPTFVGCAQTAINHSTINGILQYDGILFDETESTDPVAATHTQDLDTLIEAGHATLTCLDPFEVAAKFPNSDWSASNQGPPMIKLTFQDQPDPSNSSLDASDGNVSSPYVIGSPVLSEQRGGSYIAPRGFQMVFRGPNFELSGPTLVPDSDNDDEYPLILATIQADVDTSYPVILPTTRPRRTCVPLTIRRVVTSSTLESDASQYVVRRTDPVNCATMGSDPENINSVMFGQDGCCSSDQQLEWPSSSALPENNPGLDINAQCQKRTDVGLVSNLRTFSRWFWALSWGDSADGRILMMDPSVTTPLTTLRQTGRERSNIADLLASTSSWIGTSPPPVGSLPTCDSSSSPSKCRIAIDETGYIPCTGTQESVWFSCMNPLMTVYFPQYPIDFTTTPTTPFQRSMELYTSPKATTLRDLEARTNADAGIGRANSTTWPWFRWQQYVPCPHQLVL